VRGNGLDSVEKNSSEIRFVYKNVHVFFCSLLPFKQRGIIKVYYSTTNAQVIALKKQY
jgi:hypothetical protein